MNNISSTNNLNFNAKMNVRKMTTDSARWENISKIFEKITAKNRADECVFELSPLYGEKEIWINSDSYIANGGVINEKLYDQLMKLSDEKIASKFKKLLNLLTKPRDTAAKVAEKVEKYTDDINYKNLDYKVYDAVELSLKRQSYNAMNKDKFLRDLDIEIY